MSDFIIEGGYPGYTYVGHAWGRREPSDAEMARGIKEKQPYWQLFVISPVSSYSSDDYCAFGLKAEKHKCLGAVWEGLDLEPGQKIRLFFDQKNRVQMIALD